jgi:cytosine permease
MGREGWIRRLGPWAGIGTSPAALMAGGGVAEGIEGVLLVVALVLGTLALGTLATTQGVLGQRSGRSLLQLTAGPLGSAGSRATASLAMLAMMLGWFALNVSVAGEALARLVDIPDRAGMALFAALMLAVVWRGINVLSWSALAAGVATTALAAYGLAEVVANRDLALRGAGGAVDPVGAVQGIALMVGYGAAFSLRTPDFTHDLARPRFVVWCALVGMVLPVIAFGLVGATLQISTGSWDLSEVLRELDSPTIAFLFLAVGFSGSVMTNIYSGALSLSDAIPRISHRPGLVGVAIVGTGLAALHFSRWMIPYLTVMALSAPPLIGICVLDALRFRRARDREEAKGPAGARGGWHVPGLMSWAAGFVAGLALYVGGSSLALPGSLAVAMALYTLFSSRAPLGVRRV